MSKHSRNVIAVQLYLIHSTYSNTESSTSGWKRAEKSFRSKLYTGLRFVFGAYGWKDRTFSRNGIPYVWRPSEHSGEGSKMWGNKKGLKPLPRLIRVYSTVCISSTFSDTFTISHCAIYSEICANESVIFKLHADCHFYTDDIVFISYWRIEHSKPDLVLYIKM